MADLHRKPSGTTGKVHDITPATAAWRYVGFGLYRLGAGETAAEPTGEREAILVLVEGRAAIEVGGESFGELGGRMEVFERSKPWSVYVPNGSGWSARARRRHARSRSAPRRETAATRRASSGRATSSTRRAEPARTPVTSTPSPWSRRDVADRLLVTEVFTPPGNWSSYPPHRHDEDDYPNITYLEETYYHRVNPARGFGIQRVFTEDGSLDETMAVVDHDVVLVPRGHHPCGAPYGYELYYLNVMAGPMRKWRFKNHPDHAWVIDQDRI